MSFTIGGVKVTIRFFFFAFLALLSITAGTQIILSSVLFSLLHECGHLAALFWFDCKPEESIYFDLEHYVYKKPKYL